MQKMLSILIAFAVPLSIITPITHAQEPEEQAYLLQDDRLLAIGSQTGIIENDSALSGVELMIFTASNADTTRVVSSSLSIDAALLYTIEAYQWDITGYVPTATRLVQRERTSNVTRILIDRPGLAAFSITADHNYIAIGYYEGEYGTSRSRLCIFNLNTNMCGV